MSAPLSRLEPKRERGVALRRLFSGYTLLAAERATEFELCIQARDAEDTTCFLHFLVTDLQRDAAMRRAWLEDCEAARDWVHPGMLPVHDCGENLGLVWRRSPYDELTFLDVLVPRVRAAQGSFDLRAVLSIGVDLARTLAYVQAQSAGAPRPYVFGRIGLAHVGLLADGQPVLSILPSPDGRFATGGGRFMRCLPAELAPEQLSGGATTVATDIYQLVLLMYTLWTGGRPFLRYHRAETVVAVREGAESLAGLDRLPPELGALFRSALARNPAKRLSDPRLLAAALEESLDALGGRPEPEEWTELLQAQSDLPRDDQGQLRLEEEANALVEAILGAGVAPPSLVMPALLSTNAEDPTGPVEVVTAPVPPAPVEPLSTAGFTYTWQELRPVLTVAVAGVALVFAALFMPTGPRVLRIDGRTDGPNVAVHVVLDQPASAPQGVFETDPDGGRAYVVRLPRARSTLVGTEVPLDLAPVDGVRVELANGDVQIRVSLEDGAGEGTSVRRAPDGLEVVIPR